MKTALVITLAIVYAGSIIVAFPLIKKLSKQGFYRIPFIPLKRFFIKRHGNEVYQENKQIIDQLLLIKWVSTLSMIAMFAAILFNPKV